MDKQQEALKLAAQSIKDLMHALIEGRMAGDDYMPEELEAFSVLDAIEAALAQPAQEPHNFCPRCAKRLWGVLGQPQVHTCTPPLWGYK